jgi:CubicO group peptidase (beta-lactamase class C family)
MKIVALTLLLASFSLQAGSGSVPSKFKAVAERMQTFVDDGTISGAVTLVAHKGDIVSLEAVGLADMANKKPMRPDSLFWIASMTKPITATAIMMLQEESKLSVDDPVEKYLPEFKNQWLIETKTADSMALKRPPRPITLRDLLTHTSGLSDLSAPRRNCTLAELAMAYSQLPLKFPPGTKWEYCNSGINVLGRIVEVTSGHAFASFLQDRIFKPLGMRDTTFWPTPSQAKRFAKTYQPGKDGKGLEEGGIWFIKDDVSDRSRTAYASGGLFSTAQDMWRFYQMVLNGGEFNGKRLVSRESVDVMTRTQTGDIRTGFTDGMSFGYGWAVVKNPTGITAMLSPGTFGHGGAYGTQGWVDPKKELICVLMIQRVRLQNADDSPIRKAFQEAAVAAIAE